MIDSEVSDENELVNSAGDATNEEGQHSSPEAIDSEYNELEIFADDIEIDVLQEDDIALLKIYLAVV